MPQVQLPIFPPGSVQISLELAFKKENKQIVYFNGSMPVFTHDEHDTRSFRMITSQFCVTGVAKQAEIVRAFGITSISIKRSVKLYRKKGVKGFYEPRHTRGAVVLTESVLKAVQALLDRKCSVPDIAKKLELKPNTIDKAIRAGRLYQSKKKSLPIPSPF